MSDAEPRTEAGRTFLSALRAMDALEPILLPVDWKHGILAIEDEAVAAARTAASGEEAGHLSTQLVLRAGHTPDCGEGAEFPWDCTCDYAGFMEGMGQLLTARPTVTAGYEALRTAAEWVVKVHADDVTIPRGSALWEDLQSLRAALDGAREEAS